MVSAHEENVTDVREMTESDGIVVMENRKFTNTALPVFSGAEGWYQHIHIVLAIVKSNGWPDETAALQLFVHLKGEALNVALLLTKEERGSWTGLVGGLAAYFQSPGRLAGQRRRFESTFRQPGLDPAMLATDLGMLAIQGFGDMKEQARDTMIRDKFIAGQGQCALRRQLDGFAQGSPIGEIVDSCRVWESHSDSNRIPTANYDSEVGSQSSDSRTWERRKVVDMERREPEAGYRKNDSGLGTAVDRWCQLMGEEARERDRPPTGGPACILGGNDGHEVNRHPEVGAVQLQALKTRWPNWDNKQYRVKNKNQKLMKSPGNEQRSEREGQPLGPPEIKAPLTLVGVPAEISIGDPLGMNGGTIVRVTSGRPRVRNFHHWERRRRPERPRDRPVPVTPKWTGDRWATRHRSSEIWTGRCGRLKTLGRFREGTVMLRRGESRNP